MQIKLLTTSISQEDNVENLIAKLLLEYRRSDDFNFLKTELSLLSNFYLTIELLASANLFLNLYNNKDLNITLCSSVFGMESFNILIKNTHPKLNKNEIDIIKQYVMDGFGIFLEVSKKEPTNYSLSNLLPLCHLKKALVSGSLKAWIEFILLIERNNHNDELVDLNLLSSKVKNFIVDLYPQISKVFGFERQLEYNLASDNKKESSHQCTDNKECCEVPVPPVKKQKNKRENKMLLK
jgi:hypothetical protein